MIQDCMLLQIFLVQTMKSITPIIKEITSLKSLMLAVILETFNLLFMADLVQDFGYSENI